MAARLRQINNLSKKHAVSLQFEVQKLFHDVDIELLADAE